MPAIRSIASALVVCVAVSSCKFGTVTHDDTQRMRDEFSKENYEKNMRALGKEKELEEAKRKEQEYLQGGQSQGR